MTSSWAAAERRTVANMARERENRWAESLILDRLTRRHVEAESCALVPISSQVRTQHQLASYPVRDRRN
jgi:hypothetical protein